MNIIRNISVLAITALLLMCCNEPKSLMNNFTPGDVLLDNNGIHVNAHGGGVLYHNNKYYWFGEHKSDNSNSAWVGITCYSSNDLYNWKYEGIALPVQGDETSSDIIAGCTMERPKVIYNKRTKKFVMYFHLELKGQGYEAARVGIAISNNITGPYSYLKSCRPNAGYWPMNMSKLQINDTLSPEDFTDWWTEEWRSATENGMFVRRDFEGGQMSRDMTLFVDDDDKAYHIYSSEENLTLHIAELNDDYTEHTGKYIRIKPGGHNEAPAIFKKDGKYFLITSGCTGWKPNAARSFVASSLWGPWKELGNPCIGEDAELTFNSQSTFILPVQGKKDAFIFMADRWRPMKPIDARYIWLPIQFENNLPVLKWMDKWDLTFFDKLNTEISDSSEIHDYELVWNDEFNYEGKPDSNYWSYENGFVRNEELQWYQAENANCKNGVLLIEGKKEQVKNPNFVKGSSNWKNNRPIADYTSACVLTAGKKEFQYGRFEIRAKIPTASGSWPAIWTLGTNMPWPSNGEIDILEYYQINDVPHILANTAWGTDTPYKANWNSSTIPFREFLHEDPNWADKFHIWTMDWNEEAIRLYVDNKLLNETFLKDTKNGSVGNYTNPFKQPHYILLNLAIGSNGGTVQSSDFPLKYEIDYVRVYKKI